MDRSADLTPPLGWMGGPCKVVERIENEVRNPQLKHDLAEKVEHGDKLSNPEASKVYSLTRDKGGGLFRQIEITAHGQYRMDQRAITVGDLRVALMHYSKKLNDWKSQRAWEWTQFEQDSQRGEPIEFNDKSLGDLTVVFVNKRGTARIISTFWKGLADPKAETCNLHPRHAGIQRERDFGRQTWVTKDSPSRSDTDSPQGTDGKYPTQGLPSPPWSRSKPTSGPTVLNVPGESGSDSGGSVHKDKKRTPGVPGGQYEDGATHPTPDITDSQITPHRRPGVQAEGGGDDDEFMFEFPFELVAGYKPRFPSPHPPGNLREHEQKTQVKRYDAKRYKRKKGIIKRLVNRRYKRLKNNNRFKSRREKAKDLPARHKRRPGGGARSIAERSQRQRDKAKQAMEHTVEIPFFHEPTEEWGSIVEVSPFGVVHIVWDEGSRGTSDLDTFFDEMVLDDETLDELFVYLDEVFEVTDGMDVQAEAQTFLREQRPPEMDPETKFDRATPPEKSREQRKKNRKKKPGDPGFYNFQNEVPDSNPGSRVLPTGQGHVQREAKFNFGSLPPQCKDAISKLIRSPVWKKFVSSYALRGRGEVLRFLQDNGWTTLTNDGLDKLLAHLAAGRLARRKVAALIREIREGNAPDLLSRSEGLGVKLTRVDQKNAIWLYNVQGSKEPYRVRLKAMRKGNIQDIQKLHVKVSCSCPFWQWQGPEHWAKQGDYLYGRPRGLATTPKVKDPNGQHRACKHVLAVLHHVASKPWVGIRPKKARYLADNLPLGEMVAEYPQFDRSVRKVAARYLASLEVRDA